MVAKVFEICVHSQWYCHLDSNHLLHQAQFGFRPKHSTQDALLKAVDEWRIAVDKGKIVGAVFIDLSKAFEVIDHKLLLKKLDTYGVHGRELISLVSRLSV